jgi:hypothetical protein
MSGHGARSRANLSPEEFARFRDYIHEHSGIYLEQAKFDALRISLITRATRFRSRPLRSTTTLLVADEGEFRELMNLVTINETSFFRFPAQFEALRTFIPEILDSRKGSANAFPGMVGGVLDGRRALHHRDDPPRRGDGGARPPSRGPRHGRLHERARARQGGHLPSRALLNVPPVTS